MTINNKIKLNSFTFYLIKIFFNLIHFIYMGRSLSRIKIINRGSNPLIRYFMFTQKLKNLSDKQVLLISFFSTYFSQ